MHHLLFARYLVILDNNSGILPADILEFDYTALANDFEQPIQIRKFDIKKYPVFGFVFSENNSIDELNDILH